MTDTPKRALLELATCSSFRFNLDGLRHFIATDLGVDAEHVQLRVERRKILTDGTFSHWDLVFEVDVTPATRRS